MIGVLGLIERFNIVVVLREVRVGPKVARLRSMGRPWGKLPRIEKRWYQDWNVSGRGLIVSN